MWRCIRRLLETYKKYAGHVLEMSYKCVMRLLEMYRGVVGSKSENVLKLQLEGNRRR